MHSTSLNNRLFVDIMCPKPYSSLSNLHKVIGIQGKREREWKAEMGACKNCCYSSDSLPVKFTELCKPSHKYSIVVKFFLSHNKRQPAQNSILTDPICNLL